MGLLRGPQPPPDKEPEKKPEPEPELPDELHDEFSRVVGWRTEKLVEAGYPLKYAERIAWQMDVDLRAAERLIDEGCPPKTATDILL